MDKEMQDESKGGDYDMSNPIMSKLKGNMMGESGMQHPTFSRQATLLTTNGNKTKVIETISDRTIKVAWNPTNHWLAFGGDKEVGCLWNWDENLENAHHLSELPHSLPAHAKSANMYEQWVVTAMDWNQDGTMLITASTDGFWRLWDQKGDCRHVMFNENTMPLKQSTSYSSSIVNESKVPARPEDFDSIYDWKWNRDGTAFVTVSEK